VTKNNPAKIYDLYINRHLETKISPYINKREIIAITGPRQAGKTTFLNHLFENISKTKKCQFLTFEKRPDLEIFERDIEIFKKLYVLPNEVLIIDEVQYAKEAGQKLKYLYDTTDIKLFVSGSSNLEIRDLGKYLVGRIFNFSLYPFNFSEFLNAKNNNLYSAINKNLLSLNLFMKKSFIQNLQIKSGEVNKQLLELFKEYLIYGGYPRVVTSFDDKEKRLVLASVIDNYLVREIKSLLHLASDDNLLKLAQLLSLQIGNMISYNELELSSKLSFREVKKYIQILKETFILDLVLPFYQNRRTELTKNPKVYFLDTGLRNQTIGNFSKEIQRNDFGQLAENYVFNVLKQSESIKRVNYWRTKSQAEVDFIIETGGQIIPIEAKFSPSRGVIGKSLHSFIDKYSPKTAIITTNDDFSIKKVKGSTIYFIPIYLLIP